MASMAELRVFSVLRVSRPGACLAVGLNHRAAAGGRSLFGRNRLADEHVFGFVEAVNATLVVDVALQPSLDEIEFLVRDRSDGCDASEMIQAQKSHDPDEAGLQRDQVDPGRQVVSKVEANQEGAHGEDTELSHPRSSRVRCCFHGCVPDLVAAVSRELE